MELFQDDNQGYVKIFRKSINNGWLRSPKLWTFWCWILLTATHKEITVNVGGFNNYQRVELKPGQLIFGRKAAAKELKVSEQNIRSMLNELKRAGNISINSTNKFSVITVINWTYYQGNNDETNQPLTSNQPTTNQPLTTNKKSIYTNNKKEYNIPEKNKGECATIVSEYFQGLARVSESIADKMEKDRVRFEFECNWLLEHGYTGEQIRRAANWARLDGFWSKQFQSFTYLLKKNNQKVPHIDLFLMLADKKLGTGKITGPVNPTREYFASGNARTEVKK